MRSPERIDKFCDELKVLWHKVPNWRFGQLMSNVLGAVYRRTDLDPFYVEDDEMLSALKETFEEWESEQTLD